VSQKELVAVAGASLIGDAFPPGDGALDAGDLPVNQGRNRELASSAPQRSGQFSPGPAASLAQLAQQVRTRLHIDHDVQYTIWTRSHGDD
jgi:hypothetical protein